MIFNENEKTELKKILNDSLEKEVDAFLNTLGGQIIIGAEDNRNLCGIDDVDKIALAIADRIKNNILPSAMGLLPLK